MSAPKSTKAHRRRTWIVRPQDQVGSIRRLLFASTLAMLFTLAYLYLGIALLGIGPSPNDVPTAVLVAAFFLLSLVLLGLLGHHDLRVGHRQFGPIFVIHRAMERYRDTGVIEPVRLRRYDTLQDLAAAFNSLGERILRERGEVDALLFDVARDLDGGDPVAARERIRAHRNATGPEAGPSKIPAAGTAEGGPADPTKVENAAS